jgi:glyoxylase-like metal-dependent hydrolase (beta-lactamase superfamily II)
MKYWKWTGLVAAAMAAIATAGTDVVPTVAPTPQEVAPGVWMIPGGMRPNRQPDGNSVIFEAPAGLVVVDTGRHAWHREAILELARTRKRDIAAVVNTHWHLDHVSGNPALRAAYPELLVYASDAIDGALAGFLARSAASAAAYLDDPQVAEEMREDIRGDLATIGNGAALRPDVVVTASGTMSLGGRALGINLAPDAATSGDVWLYDEKTRVAVLGDLVTLPAPFLDTACPEGWRHALGQVAGTDFEVAIPGHGAAMSRARFLAYRGAFDDFIECSNSARPQEECASGWAASVQPLLTDDPLERQRARQFAAYYVEMLRAHGGRSEYCESRPDAHGTAPVQMH